MVFLGTTGVLRDRVPRAWAGPWGRGVARDNVWHGVRLALSFRGCMFGAQRPR